MRKSSPSRNLEQSGPCLFSQRFKVIVKSFNLEWRVSSGATYCFDLFRVVSILVSVLLPSVFVQDKSNMRAIAIIIQCIRLAVVVLIFAILLNLDRLLITR